MFAHSMRFVQTHLVALLVLVMLASLEVLMGARAVKV